MPIFDTLMVLEVIAKQVKEHIANKSLKMIISRFRLMLCVVNDLLDLKRIEQGVYMPNVESFSPSEVLRMTLTIFQE